MLLQVKQRIKNSVDMVIRRQYNTHLRSVMWISIFILILCFIIIILTWMTNYIDGLITSELQLRNGSLTFLWWKTPLVKALYRIYIFNYTNIQSSEINFEDKLKVQEVGPFIYKENLTRVNLQMNTDGTITYQENRVYDEMRHNNISYDLILNVPNIPVLTAISLVREMSFLVQVSLTAILSTIQAKSYISISAKEFLWGYDDELFDFARHFMMWNQNAPLSKKFGLLAPKVGLSGDRITIETGINNLEKLGNTVKINRGTYKSLEMNDKCNIIDGSDGSMFPPFLLHNRNRTLKVFAKELCRTIHFSYVGESISRGLKTFRYKMNEHSYTQRKNVDTLCAKPICYHIHQKNCEYKGLFDVSSCHYGAPIIASFPHFYHGDNSLFKNVDGLEPQSDLHQTYIDLHPRLGVPIEGRSRMQMNIVATKAENVPFLGPIIDGTLLPVMWVEIGIDELPDSIMKMLYHAYYTVNSIQVIIQCISLSGFILSCIVLYSIRGLNY
ncbi:lysosome membrane protein 2-like isoform X1 [Trichogramma pretiosum]|uniref:lysosome membrane protein 2-like isoform X1 n=2 Tax=Trichogramma pretiosum TaxID=7493 RepID=UPI000C718B68|nr:lysosome membrane protein 2-like isoform X1 [Trichogramma pretiosum]